MTIESRSDKDAETYRVKSVEKKEVTAEVGVGQNSQKRGPWKFLIRYIKAAILQFLKDIRLPFLKCTEILLLQDLSLSL